MKFNNIPVDASTRFENDIMNSIEPFNFQELIPYNHATSNKTSMILGFNIFCTLKTIWYLRRPRNFNRLMND